MSHYTVLVIGQNAISQLAPYQENNMGDCPQEFLEFINVEEECRKKWETDTVSRVRMPDGRLISPHDDEFKVEGDNFFDRSYKVPDNLEKVEIPINLEYPDFDIYMTEYCGYKKDEENDCYGYWENPNAKWDWYQLGGRWTGFFKVKPVLIEEQSIIPAHKKGSPGIMTKSAEDGYGDSLMKKHIDIEGMRYEAETKAGEKYDRVMSVIGHLPENESWESIRERMIAEGKQMDEIRNYYHSQPRIEAIKNSKDDVVRWADADDFLMNRDQYTLNAKNSALSTFAVVKDGVWYERGKMGWWASVSDEKEKDEWNKEFNKLFDEASDDTLFSVYDCHI